MPRFEAPSPRPDGCPRPPLPAGLAIRPAALRDAARVGAIAAERDGGDPHPHEAGVARDLAAIESGAPRGLWVATLGGDVIGYGRAAHFTPATDAPADVAPPGWYLTGVVVAPEHRRRGVGEALTVARVAWLADRTDVVRYFANARNVATIDLHARLGFAEATRRFSFPGVTFEGGEGVLFECRRLRR